MVKIFDDTLRWCPVVEETFRRGNQNDEHEYERFIVQEFARAQKIFKKWAMAKEPGVSAIKLVELNYLNPKIESRVIEYREFK